MGGDLPIIQVAHFWEHAKKERKPRRERRAREERQRSHEEHEQGQEQSSHVATKAKAPDPAKQEHIGSPSPGIALSLPTQFPSVLAPPPAAVFDPAIPASVGPGPFAHAAVPAGPSRKPTPSQQALINEIGKRYGCHTCGTMDPATDSGNWVGDHQPPTSLTAPGTMQFYLSHCSQCSRRQGGFMRDVIVRGMKQ